MRHFRLTVILLLLLFLPRIMQAQKDSAIASLHQIPLNYIKEVDKRIDKYSTRISNRTEKTLTKLARWEEKIHALLKKASPATAQQLFNNNQLTFAAALEKYRKGETIVAGQRAKYDAYRDKLVTSLKYLETKKDSLDAKFIAPVKNINSKLDELNEQQDQTDAAEQFIKQRRKQLLDASLQYIGNSKYLAKISKESYYYVETLKNYKALFQDKKKAEETALTVLNKIPAFKKFMQQNSMLASLFNNGGTAGNTPNLAGLQTRASVNTLIQNQITAAGPAGAAQIRQHIQAAQAQFNTIKDKVMRQGSANSGGEEPGFKPNQQRSKTFLQRLEFGNNFQFAKNNSLLPATADIGLSVGYKLNNKSVVGIGGSYKMGYGSIQHLSITHQGVGLRSYVDWQLKKQFYLSGGYEMNYNAAFKNMEQLKNNAAWQNAGLIGLSKKINIKTKFTKSTKLSLLYDILYHEHTQVTQPLVFRMGYGL